jgi:hypothetical protein
VVYDPASAYNQGGYSNLQFAAPKSPIIGYGDLAPIPGGMVMRPGSEPVQETIMAPELIRASDLDFSTFDQEDLMYLAIDLMAVGMYDNIDYMFDENNQVRPAALSDTIQRTISKAADQAELGLGADFIDVLLQNSGRSEEELKVLFAQKKEEARSGGRIINYIDPVALIDAAKKGAASITGRMATPEESQAFVKMIHGLQASGMTGINVGARVESFFREQAPEEAKAMDYANAAGLLMQTLGIRG